MPSWGLLPPIILTTPRPDIPTSAHCSKHTIFGRVVRGWDALRAIETAKTDKHDHPVEEIKVLSITVR